MQDFNPEERGNYQDNTNGNNTVTEDDTTDVPDTGTTEEDALKEDNIDNTSFDRSIYIVFSTSGNATVTGHGSTQQVSISGNEVTINNEGDEKVRYELSGTTNDGYFKLYSSKKQAIVLNNVSIANPKGAAINNQSHKRTFVVVTASNTLADGSVNQTGDYPDQSLAEDEDMKAAFFSEGQLTFSGTGSLLVTASGKSGITSDDYVSFLGLQQVEVSASNGHGVRGNDAVRVYDGTLSIHVSGTAKKGISTDGSAYFAGGTTTIQTTGSAGTVDGELTGVAGIKADSCVLVKGGTITISSTGKGAKGINCDGEGYFIGGTVNVTTTGANYGTSNNMGMGKSDNSNSVSSKGIKFDGDLYLAGTDMTVKCSAHEGIESKKSIVIKGGQIYSHSSDDAINSGSTMSIRGGIVEAFSTGNDGLDSNGNLYIKGGVVYAVGCGNPEVAVDANTEQGYRFYLTGGTLIAFGGIESGSSLSQAVVSANYNRNTQYALCSGETLLCAFKAPASGGSGLLVSHPSLQNGSSYPLYSNVTTSGGTTYFDTFTTDASVTGGSSTTLQASTSYNSGMNGGGGNQPGGGHWGW